MEEHNSFKEFERAVAYVKENEQTLRIAYESEYIAVKDNCIVGHRKDRFELAEEIQRKFRKNFVLISTIEDILNPPEEYLRPELEV